MPEMTALELLDLDDCATIMCDGKADAGHVYCPECEASHRAAEEAAWDVDREIWEGYEDTP